jgi:hypothetical protein
MSSAGEAPRPTRGGWSFMGTAGQPVHSRTGEFHW